MPARPPRGPRGSGRGGRVVRGGAVRGLGYLAGERLRRGGSVLLAALSRPVEFGRYGTVTAAHDDRRRRHGRRDDGDGARELSQLPRAPPAGV